MTSSVMTANRLGDGAVVWLMPDDGWTDRIDEAAVFEDAAREKATEAAMAAEHRQVVVSTYLIPVQIKDGIPVPTGYRELIRALGPPARRDLGKQSTQGASVAPLVSEAGARG